MGHDGRASGSGRVARSQHARVVEPFSAGSALARPSEHGPDFLRSAAWCSTTKRSSRSGSLAVSESCTAMCTIACGSSVVHPSIFEPSTATGPHRRRAALSWLDAPPPPKLVVEAFAIDWKSHERPVASYDHAVASLAAPVVGALKTVTLSTSHRSSSSPVAAAATWKGSLARTAQPTSSPGKTANSTWKMSVVPPSKRRTSLTRAPRP